MALLTTNFLTPASSSLPNPKILHYKYYLFVWNTLFPSPHTHICYSVFYTT